MIISFLLVFLTHTSSSQEWPSVRDTNLELSDSFYPLQNFDIRRRVQRFTTKNDNPKSEFEIVTQISARPKPHQIPLSSEASKEEEFHDKLNFDLNFDGDAFIRYKRDANAKADPNPNPNPNDQIELTDLNHSAKAGDEQKSRMLLQEEGVLPDGSREPRGATKEQWIKQPYPVHSVTVSENAYEDPISSSSTDVRAPRVHFVTQKRAEGGPSLVYKNFEREGRNRDFPREEAKEPPRATPRSSPRIPERKPVRDYYQERPFKAYDPYFRAFNPYHDEPYYRYEESRYDPQYESDNYERYRPDFSSHRQRRIIYYATLPEVVRTPPNVNLRDRFNYRDRYDDRYSNSPLSITENNEYRLEKPYSFLKSRYDHEMERNKAPYPLKVSTDLNVRETKKNPERRIYSEPERRYAYKSLSYQPEGIFDRRV